MTQTLPDSALEGKVLQEKALKVLNELPPFSPILHRLLASLASEDVNLVGLGDLIEKDTVVAGNLLHLVNSALYGRRNRVNSVRYALSLLGINKVRNMVLGMQVAGMWNQARCPKGLSMKRFNMHSACVATLCDTLAQQAPVEYPEGAFIAGLLHDVGRLLIAMGLPAEFMEIQALHAKTGQPLTECEASILGFTHADLSESALKVWKLPEPVLRAAVQHHRVDDAVVPSESTEIPLGRALAAANRYVNSRGLSTFEEPTEEPDLSWIVALGIAQARAERIVSDFDAEVQATAQYFR